MAGARCGNAVTSGPAFASRRWLSGRSRRVAAPGRIWTTGDAGCRRARSTRSALNVRGSPSLAAPRRRTRASTFDKYAVLRANGFDTLRTKQTQHMLHGYGLAADGADPHIDACGEPPGRSAPPRQPHGRQPPSSLRRRRAALGL